MVVARMKTTVTELPESRVRVEAEVPAEELDRAIEQTARSLGRDLRIPGFRKGKVPAPVVVRRLGRPAVLDEAVRGGIARWYGQALDESGVRPIGDPQLDLGELPGPGAPLAFSFEVGVRPTATLGEHEGIEVPRREPEVGDAEVEAEVDRLRDRAARLDTVERTAENGDFVVVDYLGRTRDEDGDLVPFAGGEGRDQLIELGAGQLIPGFEEQLTGTSAGEAVTVEVTFPPDYPAETLAGRDAVFDVQVKEVKAKQLPELDDDFAVEAGGADTMDELRADIRTRLEDTQRTEIEGEFREAVLDAIVDRATVEVPDALVEARARELWERMLHQLEHQGVSRDTYLRISGQDEETLLAEAKPEAERALRRDAVVSALTREYAIDPTEQDYVDALRPTAERSGQPPEQLLERLKADGRLDEVREDLSARLALDRAVERAKPIAPEQAAARDAIWTPGEERPQGTEQPSGGLWTPSGR